MGNVTNSVDSDDDEEPRISCGSVFNSRSNEEEHTDELSENSTPSIIDVTRRRLDQLRLQSDFSTDSKTNETEESNYMCLEEALRETRSPLIPLRGHALISLNRLLSRGDIDTLSRSASLLGLFQHHLREEDSFVYLSAVEALSSLCAAKPTEVLPWLGSQLIGSRVAVEERLKAAETLTRAARKLGGACVAHKTQLVNACLRGVADTEGLVRAACLSALGEVCGHLRHALQGVMQDVLHTVACVVRDDLELEPRRAAVLVLTLLLRGLGPMAIQTLRDAMLDVYRALKHIAVCDADHVMRVHAGVALDEIDALTREFLLPKHNLTKKIYVTETPPSF